MELIFSNPLFGIVLSTVAFLIGTFIYKKTKLAVLNPLALAIIIVSCVLLIFNIKFDDYNSGGQFITLLLSPATVVLAVPLFDQIELIKKNAAVILISISVGTLTSIISIWGMCKLSGLDRVLLMSLVPKSITTAIAIDVSANLGGIKAITVIAVILSGIIGAVLGPIILKLLRVKSRVAVGLAIGTASHAVGTSKAIEIGEDEGAMSGLAIGIAGLLTVVAAPLLINLLIKVWGY